MRKQFLLTLMISFLAVSAWGTDWSWGEDYHGAPGGGMKTESTPFSGYYANWHYNYARSKATDIIGDDRAFWITNNGTDKEGYLECDLAEGGIKSISFDWRQAAAGDATDAMYLSILADETEVAKIEETATNPAISVTPFSSDLNIKTNVKLTLKNLSTTTRELSSDVNRGRFIVGPITITPYLRYMQKEVTIGLPNKGYINRNLLDQIDEVHTITYSIDNESVATINPSTGAITPVAAGTAIVKATWAEEGAYTTYELTVVANKYLETFNKNEVNASTPWAGDIIPSWNVKGVNRRPQDTLSINVQGTFMQTTGNTESDQGYLQTASGVEGGVKAVDFDWKQFGNARNCTLRIETSLGGTQLDQMEQAGVADITAQGHRAITNSSVYSNAVLEIRNTGTKGSGEKDPNPRVVIGDVLITPWLLYTTKEVTIDTRYSGTYKNNDLIDNTGGGVSYASNNEAVATVDGTGEVTIAGPGVATITATWGSVNTSYKLYVDDVIIEDFNHAPTGDVQANTRLSFNGNNFTWYYRNARSQTTDKLRNDDRGFWMSRGSGNSCYLESETEGGIKKVDFNWRQWTKDEHEYHFVMQIMTKNDEILDEVSFIGAADYWNNDQSYSKILSIRKNKSKFKINNISTSDGTTVKGKLLVGPITITPYLLYTRKSVSAKLTDGTFVNAQLINNTASEAGSLSFSSSNTTVAEVDANGEVTLHAPGTTVITATFTWEDDEYVSTSYALSVVESTSLVEDYSKIPNKNTGTVDGEGHSYSGNYSKWWYRNAKFDIGNAGYRLIDGTPGFWLAHTATDISNTSAYIESARTGDPYQEGGIKNASFKWHQFGNAESQTIYLSIQVNGTEKDKIEVAGGKNTVDICVNDQTYESNNEVSSKSNAKLTIKNVSYVTGSDPKVDAQGRVIIGPISITPYIFYLNREVTIIKNKPYVHPLLDNTDNEGAITYTLESPSSSDMATINSRTGEVVATKEGDVTVKATWSEGAYATYTLHVDLALQLNDNEDNRLTLTSYDGETANVNTNRTLVGGAWNTLCMPFEINVSELGEGVDVQDLFGVEQNGEDLIFGFKPITEDVLEAGHPYLVKPAENVTLTGFEDRTIVASPMTLTRGDYALVGVFSPLRLTNDGKTLFVGPYVENQGNLYYPSSSGNTINGFRAYFKKVGGPAAAPKRVRYVVNYNNTATDIEAIMSDGVQVTGARKIIRDGQLFIIRDERIYNAQGILVR